MGLRKADLISQLYHQPPAYPRANRLIPLCLGLSATAFLTHILSLCNLLGKAVIYIITIIIKTMMAIGYLHCIKSQPPTSVQLHSGSTLTTQQHTQELFRWEKKLCLSQ